MKKSLVVASLVLSAVAQAHMFESGTKIKCYDSVSDYTYLLKVIGDVDANIKVSRNGKLLNEFINADFNYGFEDTRFTALSNGNEEFQVVFPKHDLSQAYYADGGDSRALECKFVR